MKTPSERLSAEIRAYTAGHSLNDCDDDNCLLCAAAAALWMCEATRVIVIVDDEPEDRDTSKGGRPRTDADTSGLFRTCRTCGREKPIGEFQPTTNGNRRHQCRWCQYAPLRARRAERKHAVTSS